MNTNVKGVQKILWQSMLEINGTMFDVLIPLPANHDECLNEIGITDFADQDDTWDSDFMKILRLLTDESSKIEVYNLETRTLQTDISLSLDEIPLYLSQADHHHIIISSTKKKITFTNGHEIFWLQGYSSEDITSLGFQLEEIEKPRLSEIY